MSGEKELTTKQKELLLKVIDTLPVQGTLEGVSSFIDQMNEIKDVLSDNLKEKVSAKKTPTKTTKKG